MAEAATIEKFTPTDLARLREKLIRLRSDSRHAAELVSEFLAGRGYGVDTCAVRTAAAEFTVIRNSHDSMQSLLETVAYVM